MTCSGISHSEAPQLSVAPGAASSCAMLVLAVAALSWLPLPLPLPSLPPPVADIDDAELEDVSDGMTPR